MNMIMSKNFKPFFESKIEFKKFLTQDWLEDRILECENDLRNKRYNISANIGLILESFLKEILYSFFKQDEDMLKSKQINDLIGLCCDYISLDSYVISSMHSLKSSRNNFSHSSDLSIHGATEIDCANMLRSLQIVLYYFLKKIYKINLDGELLSFSLGVYNIEKQLNVITEKDKEKISKFSNSVSKDIDVNKIPIFTFIFSELKKIFTVPIYQRGYDWDEENVETLCNDILKRTKDNHSHYLGVIAVKKEKNETKDNLYNVKILDGQQRITTTLLIIMAIKNIVKKNYNDKLDKIGMFKKIDEYILKLDINLGNIIVNPGGSTELNNEFENILNEKNIKYNYSYGKNFENIEKYLYKNLKEWSDIVNFISILEEKLIVAIVDFDQNYVKTKKELEIFENLNSKGKSLESFDLIKNYLFNLCKNEVLEKEEKNIVICFNTKILSSFDNNTKDTKEFFEHFIMYYLGEEIKGKNKDISTFKKFEIVIEYLMGELGIISNGDGLDFNDFNKIIKFFSKYIKIYNEMKKKNFLFFQEFKIKPLLMSMQVKKTIPLHYVSFLIIDLYNNFDFLQFKDKKDIGRIYILFIEYLTLKSLMKDQGESGPKRTICIVCKEAREKFINKVIKINELIEFINNKLKEKTNLKREDFKERLSSRKESNWATTTSLILMEYKLSNYLKDNSSNMDFSNISLEHILPQDAKEWNDNIIEWNRNKINDISINNIKEYSIAYENMIGNFLILSSSKNSSISNKKFNEKIDKYNKSNISNWKIYDNSIEKDLDVKNKKEWTFECVENRTKFINDYFLNELFKNLLN